MGYYPPHPLQAGGLLLLQALVVLSLRMLFGSFLGTLASGIVPLLVYGLGWMGGMIETLGHALQIDSLISSGIVISLFIPTDAVWRGASALLLPEVSSLASSALGISDPARGIPFISTAPIAGPMLIWAIAYTTVALLGAARIFARRDV